MKKKINKQSTALFIFPGQGSQYTGMGLDLIEKYPKLKDIYNTANDILEYDILEIIPSNILKFSSTGLNIPGKENICLKAVY